MELRAFSLLTTCGWCQTRRARRGRSDDDGYGIALHVSMITVPYARHHLMALNRCCSQAIVLSSCVVFTCISWLYGCYCSIHNKMVHLDGLIAPKLFIRLLKLYLSITFNIHSGLRKIFFEPRGCYPLDLMVDHK